MAVFCVIFAPLPSWHLALGIEWNCIYAWRMAHDTAQA
jgi:hypothetical protein